MKLADYMEAASLDDEAMAEKLRTDDLPCDRTKVLRYRRGERRPEWSMIERIFVVTKGAVTANDWMALESAPQ